MFSHIGRKVKGLAVAVCTIGILGSLGAGVALYLTKVLELIPCIAIGVGGTVVSWLGSWVLYCIGDTHAKIERLENKLIPKPSYAEYLAGNGPTRGACEICGRTTDLINARIEDQLGVRYRKVCRECFAANNATEAN
jgi:hypothetical protein